MPETTLRPNSTTENEGSVVGAATAHEATSDDNENTWAEEAGFDKLQVALADPAAIPASAAIRQVRVRSRSQKPTDQSGSTGGRYELQFRPGNFGSLKTAHAFTPLPKGEAGYVSRTGPWHVTNVDGGPWTRADVVALQLRAALTSSSTPLPTMRWAELWVDVEYNERPVGSLDGPAGLVNDRGDPPVEWTYSDPENDPQEAFRVVVESGDQTADSAPDDHIVYDSGKVFDGATSHDLPVLEDGTYTVWLRVWQPNVSGAEHPSAWDASTFEIATSPPAVPDVTLTVQTDEGRIEVAVDSDSPVGEEAETYDLEASDDGGATWTPVRGATMLAPDSGVVDTVATVHDYEAPPNSQRLYRARAGRQIAAGRTVSAWSAPSGATFGPDGWWLKDPGDPTLNWEPDVDRFTQGGLELTFTAELHGLPELATFEALWDAGRVLLLQSPQDQWYIRMLGDRQGVHHPLGRRYPVVVDDGHPGHPPVEVVDPTMQIRRVEITTVRQERP